MNRPDLGSTRMFFVTGLWALVLMPVLVSSQTAGQGTGQGTGQETSVRILRPTGDAVVIQGRGPLTTRRIADMPRNVPPDNPMSDDKVALGKRLFFDKQLSLDRTVSCATCHEPERAFADTRALAVGVGGKVGRRNSPTLVNRVFGRRHFWDGRAATLEEQTLQPITDPVEMALPLEELMKRLEADASYREAFEKSFLRPATSVDVGRALATYLRTITSIDTPYDKFVAGAADALSAEAQAGLQVFRGKGRCGICHREPAFSDENFYNTGVAWRVPADGSAGDFQDVGRSGVTNNVRERGAFKVPTLREISSTAPYMHDGSLATLQDVVEFYDKGGRANPTLMPLIRPLALTPEEKRVLVVFLESLSGVVSGK